MVLERRKGNHPQHSSVIMVEETVSSSSSTTKLHFHSPLELELEEQRQFLPSTGEDEDKEERVHTSRSKGISDLEAGFSLAKAIMGAGSFALPWAFLQMGGPQNKKTTPIPSSIAQQHPFNDVSHRD